MKNQYSKLLRILITGILYIGYFSISSLLAQISEGGLPPSFQFAGSLRSEKLAEQVPVNFSVEDLKAVDAWRVSQGAPLRVAKSIPTSFDIANSGDWISLPDGSQVWQLHLQAKGAIALILYYSDCGINICQIIYVVASACKFLCIGEEPFHLLLSASIP